MTYKREQPLYNRQRLCSQLVHCCREFPLCDLTTLYLLQKSTSNSANSNSWSSGNYHAEFNLAPPIEHIPTPPPLVQTPPPPPQAPPSRKRSVSSTSHLMYCHSRTAPNMPLSKSLTDGFNVTVAMPTRRGSNASHAPIQVTSRTPSPGSRRSSRIISSLSSVEDSVELVQKVTPV